MGKTGNTKEIKKPAPAAVSEKAPAAGGPSGGGSGSGAHHGAPHGPAQGTGPKLVGGKAGAGTKVGCHAAECKGPEQRHGFCEEHFRQFKFGLITKAGEKVSDYEKKWEHYQNWIQTQKVA